MKALSLSLRRSAGLLACAGLAATANRLGAADPASAPDPFQAYPNYIKVSGQFPVVSNDKAAYAERNLNNSNGNVGIEDLHLGQDLDKKTAMELDGHMLYGAADYLGKISFTRNEVGSLEIGYKRFRSFYDGIGGFFPLNSYWSPLTKEELHTDRGAFWADLKIALPDAPVFRFRYSEELRTGQKDSTIWGDTDNTGIFIWSTGSLNPYSAARKLVPAYIDLNEHLKTLEASATHKIGKTTIELSAVWTKTDNNDTRWVNRYPGEIKPYPAIAANRPVTAAQANNAVYGFDQQMVKSTSMNYTGKFETAISDRLSIFGGLSYQHLTADIGGDREMTTDIMTSAGRVSSIGGFSPSTSATSGPGRPPYSYRMIDGGTNQDIVEGNVGLKVEAAKDLFVTVALKGESTDAYGHNQVNFINTKVVLTSGATSDVPVNVANQSKFTETAWVPEIDVRYSGIKNLTLYSNFDYRKTSGDETAYNGALGSVGTGAAGTWMVGTPVTAEDNTGEKHGHYKVGANWNPCSFVTLRGELFYRDHRNSFTDMASSTDGFVLGYQYHGVKLTGVFKPMPGLTFTSRYVGQVGKMDVAVDSGTSYDSMDSRNHLFGETLDFAPSKQVYLQANFNMVFATIETAYPRAGGTANLVMQKADNNYWNASFVAGVAAGPSTNVELQASTYRSNNFHPLLASMAYGAEARESSITLAVKQKFTDRLRGTAKVGYVESHNVTTGGFTDYHGPMGYLSLEYSL